MKPLATHLRVSPSTAAMPSPVLHQHLYAYFRQHRGRDAVHARNSADGVAPFSGRGRRGDALPVSGTASGQVSGLVMSPAERSPLYMQGSTKH